MEATARADYEQSDTNSCILHESEFRKKIWKIVFREAILKYHQTWP